MIVILCVIGPALLAGAAAMALVKRWPAPAAPRLEEATLVAEVRRHPRLRRRLEERTDPNGLTGLLLTAAIAMVVMGALAIGSLLAMINTHSGLAHFDLAFARYGATHAGSVSTAFLRDVSQLGGYWGAIVIGSIVAVVEVRRTRSPAVIGFLVLVIAGQFAVVAIIKGIVDRARPDIHPLTGFSGASFPSGHATASAATFMACALLLGRRRSTTTKAALAGVAVGLACAVAATRVLLGVHWFTDVLAGLLLGWIWFAICSIAFGGRVLRFGTPVERAEAAAPLVESSTPELAAPPSAR